MLKRALSVFMILSAASTAARASVAEAIQRSVSERLGANRVEILGAPILASGQPLDDAEAASVLEENARGEVRVLVRGWRGKGAGPRVASQAEYRVRVAAWVLGWVAGRRVLPGEALVVDALKVQEINVAEGLAHEYRGILLAPTEDLSRLEARQTLIEGGFVTSAAVRKIPDLRRGDVVRLEVISGGVRLSTSALALEPASTQQRVRVQTVKAKRELVGTLKDGGIVEVVL